MDSTSLPPDASGSRQEIEMSKTITATIKARTVRMSNGKSHTFAAHTKTLMQDDAGRWTIDLAGNPEPITEAEAIDVLSKSSDWDSIRREHFPMHGFHN
jgi:hypothetical protein